MRNEAKPRIVVASHVWLGHIPAYHRALIRGFLALGCDVTSLGPVEIEGVRHVQFGIDPHTQEAAARARVSLRRIFHRILGRVLEPTGLLARRRTLREWEELGKAVNRLEMQIDLVLISYLDVGFLNPHVRSRQIERVFLWPWMGGWISAPSTAIDVASRTRKISGVLDADNCRGVLVLKKSSADAIHASRPDLPTFVIPDIADLRNPKEIVPELDELRKLAAGRHVVGLLGNLQRRKGVITFLETARLANAKGVPLFFLAAGDLSLSSSGADRDEILRLAERLSDNFLLVGRRIEDGPEFNAFVHACDLLFCAYWSAQPSSNLVTKAAHFRKPVLASRGSLVGREVERFGIGRGVEERNPDETLATLIAMTQSAKTDRATMEDGFARYARSNSEEQLQEVLAQLLDSSLKSRANDA